MSNQKIIAIKGNIYSGKDTVYNIIHLLTNGVSIDETIDIIKGKVSLLSIRKPKWENKKFAGKLKSIVALILGCTVEQLEDRDFKETQLGEEWRVFWAEYVVSSQSIVKLTPLCLSRDAMSVMLKEVTDKLGLEMGYIREHSELLTPRKILQVLGTEGGRQLIHPNIWVNSLFADLKPNSRWIITDCRFPNEVDAVKQHGGIVVDLQRKMSVQNWADIFEIEEDFSEIYAKTFKINSREFASIIKNDSIDLYNKLTHISETSLDNYNKFDYIIDNSNDIQSLVTTVRDMLVKFDILVTQPT